MLDYKHSGFSVDTNVCIEAHDRAGLERQLRYCARPPLPVGGADCPHLRGVAFVVPFLWRAYALSRSSLTAPTFAKSWSTLGRRQRWRRRHHPDARVAAL
jgi:hypothetical protein